MRRGTIGQRCWMLVTVVGLAAASVAVPLAAQEGPPDSDMLLASLPVPTGGCDIESGSLVLSWEWTNHFEAPIQITELEATVSLSPPGGGSETVETIDIGHLFPTELDAGQTVTIGPLVYPGDLWWSWSIGFTMDSELFDEPIVVVSPAIDSVGPCVAPTPPPEPVEVEPAFTG